MSKEDSRKRWIQGMGLKKGALHAQMGIPAGEKIGKARLEKAAHSGSPLMRHRAQVALSMNQ
jgi:hypothetical protein